MLLFVYSTGIYVLIWKEKELDFTHMQQVIRGKCHKSHKQPRNIFVALFF